MGLLRREESTSYFANQSGKKFGERERERGFEKGLNAMIKRTGEQKEGIETNVYYGQLKLIADVLVFTKRIYVGQSMYV